MLCCSSLRDSADGIATDAALNAHRTDHEVAPMPRYKPTQRNGQLIPVVLEEQIQPGTFEFALAHLVDQELDLCALDAKYRNDRRAPRPTTRA
jgi:hypothetical protein